MATIQNIVIPSKNTPNVTPLKVDLTAGSWIIQPSDPKVQLIASLGANQNDPSILQTGRVVNLTLAQATSIYLTAEIPEGKTAQASYSDIFFLSRGGSGGGGNPPAPNPYTFNAPLKDNGGNVTLEVAQNSGIKIGATGQLELDPTSPNIADGKEALKSIDEIYQNTLNDSGLSPITITGNPTQDKGFTFGIEYDPSSGLETKPVNGRNTLSLDPTKNTTIKNTIDKADSNEQRIQALENAQPPTITTKDPLTITKGEIELTLGDGLKVTNKALTLDETSTIIAKIETKANEAFNQAGTNKNDIADLKQVDTKLGDRITALETKAPPTITATAPITNNNGNIGIDIKAGGGLKTDGGSLIIDETSTIISTISKNANDALAQANTNKTDIKALQNKAGDYVTLKDTQTIAGEKTFDVLPKSTIAPTDGSHLTNKDYVDNQITTSALTFTQPLVKAGQNVSLTLKNDGGLKVDGNALYIDPASSVMTKIDDKITANTTLINNTKADLENKINSLTGAVEFIGEIGKSEAEVTTTPDLLTQFVQQEAGRAPRKGDFIRTNDSTGFIFNGTNWVNFGKTQISLANTQKAGIIKLGNADGELTNKGGGLVEVNGFNALKTKADANTQDLTTLKPKVNTLETQMAKAVLVDTTQAITGEKEFQKVVKIKKSDLALSLRPDGDKACFIGIHKGDNTRLLYVGRPSSASENVELASDKGDLTLKTIAANKKVLLDTADIQARATYTPTNSKSLTTKEYVDNAITQGQPTPFIFDAPLKNANNTISLSIDTNTLKIENNALTLETTKGAFKTLTDSVNKNTGDISTINGEITKLKQADTDFDTRLKVVEGKPTITGTSPIQVTNGVVSIALKANSGLKVDTNELTIDPSVGALKTALDSKANDSDVVKLTRNQTINGNKTFGSPIVIPNATADNQAVNKGQMDTAITNATGDFARKDQENTFTKSQNIFHATDSVQLAIKTTATNKTAQIVFQDSAGNNALTIGKTVTNDNKMRIVSLRDDLEIKAPTNKSLVGSAFNISLSASNEFRVSGNVIMGTNLKFGAGGATATMSPDTGNKTLKFGGSASNCFTLDMGGYSKITNLPAPTANGDATNKQYVDNAVAGVGGNFVTLNTRQTITAEKIYNPDAKFELTTKADGRSGGYVMRLNADLITSATEVEMMRAHKAGAKGKISYVFGNGGSYQGIKIDPVAGDLELRKPIVIGTDNALRIKPAGNNQRAYIDILNAGGTPIAMFGKSNTGDDQIQLEAKTSDFWIKVPNNKKFIFQGGTFEVQNNLVQLNNEVRAYGDVKIGNRLTAGNGANNLRFKTDSGEKDLFFGADANNNNNRWHLNCEGRTKIKNVPTPTADGDVATKKYVDDKVSGGTTPFKFFDDVADITTANLADGQIGFLRM